MVKKKNDNQGKWVYTMSAMLVVAIVIVYFLRREERKELAECGVKTNGIVTKIYHMKSRGDYFKYRYTVNKVQYLGDQDYEHDFEGWRYSYGFIFKQRP
jgi:hypothetical protein